MHAGHEDSVEAVALSAVLPVAATASIDGKVLIWDNATLSVRGTCEHPEVQHAGIRSWSHCAQGSFILHCALPGMTIEPQHSILSRSNKHYMRGVLLLAVYQQTGIRLQYTPLFICLRLCINMISVCVLPRPAATIARAPYFFCLPDFAEDLFILGECISQDTQHESLCHESM